MQIEVVEERLTRARILDRAIIDDKGLIAQRHSGGSPQPDKTSRLRRPPGDASGFGDVSNNLVWSS